MTRKSPGSVVSVQPPRLPATLHVVLISSQTYLSSSQTSAPKSDRTEKSLVLSPPPPKLARWPSGESVCFFALLHPHTWTSGLIRWEAISQLSAQTRRPTTTKVLKQKKIIYFNTHIACRSSPDVHKSGHGSPCVWSFRTTTQLLNDPWIHVVFTCCWRTQPVHLHLWKICFSEQTRQLIILLLQH